MSVNDAYFLLNLKLSRVHQSMTFFRSFKIIVESQKQSLEKSSSIHRRVMLSICKTILRAAGLLKHLTKGCASIGISGSEVKYYEFNFR